jgi:glycosyltransferase involved in cell wall biosynthesis
MRIKQISVDLFHNILWSNYKAVVFSKLYGVSEKENICVNFYQISETEANRVGLAPVDLSFHNYPYKLLFSGSYEAIGLWRRIRKLSLVIIGSKADLILLPGYHYLEHWFMLLFCVVLRKRRAVFCDSTLRDQPQRWYKSVLKSLFFKYCDGFFVYGIRAREHVCAYGADPARVFERCQAAAPLPNYDRNIAFEYRRQRIKNFNANSANLLYVGRLSAEKGIYNLIDAFSICLGSINAQL